MIYNYLILFLIIFINVSCLQKIDETSKKIRYGSINYNYSDGYLKEDFNRLKGDIEMLEQLDYLYSSGELNKKINYASNRTGKYHFNPNGEIEYKSDYDSEFNPHFERWYLDYSNDQIQKQIEVNGTEERVTEHIFNDNNIPIALLKGGVRTDYQIHSNSDSLIVESNFEIRKYQSNTLISKFLKANKVTIKYEYHSNGNRKSIRSFDWKNRMDSEYIFNDQKDILSQTVVSYRFSEYLDDIEVTAFRTLHEYDSNTIDRSLLYEIGYPINESIKYIVNDLVVESGGQTYQYNEHGNLIKIYEGENKLKSVFTYEYDSQNNWIKRVEYHDDTEFKETIRNFKYYKKSITVDKK